MPDIVFQMMSAISLTIWTVLGVALVYGNLDRSLPVEIADYTVNEPPPGGVLYVALTVRQDPRRDCRRNSLVEIVDSSGARFGIQRELDFREEDRSRLPQYVAIRSMAVPLDAKPGPAAVVFRSEFACTPAQLFFPIEKILRVPFTIRRP